MKPDPIATALQDAFQRGVEFAAEQCDSYARILRGPVSDVDPQAQQVARVAFDLKAAAADEIAASLRKAIAAYREQQGFEAQPAQGQVS